MAFEAEFGSFGGGVDYYAKLLVGASRFGADDEVLVVVVSFGIRTLEADACLIVAADDITDDIAADPRGGSAVMVGYEIVA